MSESKLCPIPGCGAEMVERQSEHGHAFGDVVMDSFGDSLSEWECEHGTPDSPYHQKCRENAAQAERIRDLEAAIQDIDAHATPCGLLDESDPEGSPHHYLVTTGSLHRALGIKVGGAYRERPRFTKEMIQECLRRATPAANELNEQLRKNNLRVNMNLRLD